MMVVVVVVVVELMMMIMMMMISQLNSHLLMCQLNSTVASYKASTK
jgi:hypothetical protein